MEGIAMELSAKPYLREVSLRQDMEIPFADYPFNIPAIRQLDHLQFHPDVTFLVGENGAGKSTILEGIAMALGYGQEGGTKNVRQRTTESVSRLWQALNLVHGFRRPKDGYFLRAESFFNVATYMDEVGYLEGYGGVSLHQRSHGEAFMSLLVDKLRGNGLYLFDEPEAALSPYRQLAALSVIHRLVKKESQFIIATHSPILLAYPNARILKIGESGIAEVAFEETEHFAVTRDFLNNYPKRLEQWLAGQDGPH
jgi:predicted ATPase